LAAESVGRIRGCQSPSTNLKSVQRKKKKKKGLKVKIGGGGNGRASARKK